MGLHEFYGMNEKAAALTLLGRVEFKKKMQPNHKLKEIQEAHDLVENLANGDGSEVFINRSHIVVWEPYGPSWLETQPGNITQA